MIEGGDEGYSDWVVVSVDMPLINIRNGITPDRSVIRPRRCSRVPSSALTTGRCERHADDKARPPPLSSCRACK
jgi:hypothetical protein